MWTPKQILTTIRQKFYSYIQSLPSSDTFEVQDKLGNTA